MLDILIQNGLIVDGSGSPRYRADVAVEGERIAAVGRLEGAGAETVIDASGCVVAPGFVDMHSHADLTLPVNPTADSLVHQGITTVVMGQCGLSPVPLLAGTREQVIATLQFAPQSMPWDAWSSFGSYLETLSQTGISLNAVPLVGQGTVRGGVMGLVAGAPSAEQVASMQAQVVQAMEEGATGVSSGLIYPPGSWATTEELIAVVRPAAQRGGLYFSHIRGEGEALLAAVAEAIRIGRETGAAVQISHFKAARRENWGKAAGALQLIDAARAEGLDVTADVYPYLAGSTTVVALLPEWAQEGGKAATLARLADAGARARMAADMQTTGDFLISEWDKVLISSSPRRRDYEGRDIAGLAVTAGQTQRPDRTPHEWVFDALLETNLEMDMVLFEMSEENLQLAMRHPATMIGTDGFGLATEGPLSAGVPHPRSYGTTPRVLGRYVREEKVLSLEGAIWKMSGFPAQKLGWTERGLVRRGYKADLVVFDPEAVADRATYAEPHQYPAGIPHVIVNGELVVHEGVHTGARPGRVLR